MGPTVYSCFILMYLLWGQYDIYSEHSNHGFQEQAWDHSLLSLHPVLLLRSFDIEFKSIKFYLDCQPVARGQEHCSQSWGQSICPWCPHPQSKTQMFLQNQIFHPLSKLSLNCQMTRQTASYAVQGAVLWMEFVSHFYHHF